MSNQVEPRPAARAGRTRARMPRKDAGGTAPPQTAPETDPGVDLAGIAADEIGTICPAIEAVLLSVDRPVSALRLAEALGMLSEAAADADQADEPTTPARQRSGSPLPRIRAAVSHLNNQYAQTGRSFRIEAVAGGYRILTLAAYAPVIERFLGKRERTSLSRPAVETLAIIAYRQPITRAALEAIRGVACGEVLKTLMERRLVTMTGRAEELGRPMLYGTTKQFLEAFGLASLKDLPSPAEFRARHLGGEPE